MLFLVDSQTKTLPGLGRTEAELIEAVRHHAACLMVGIGELQELLEDTEDPPIDGDELQAYLAAAWAFLRTFEAMKTKGGEGM